MDTGELQGQHVVLGNMLSEIKTKVMYRLIEDEALCKLLYYDTPDALDHNITAKQIQEGEAGSHHASPKRKDF